MASAVDLANRALDSIAAEATITNFVSSSKESQACGRWYDPTRRMLLRAAPWAFARRQLTLTLLGSLAEETGITPWAYKYTYPAECLKVRYLIPPAPNSVDNMPLTGDFWAPFASGYRGSPFIIANELDGSTPRKVVLSNLANAIAVYIVDEETVDLFDDMFTEALVTALAARLVMTLTANENIFKMKVGEATQMVQAARAADSEAIATTDSVPDWIKARGISSGLLGGPWQQGCYVGYDNMSWGM